MAVNYTCFFLDFQSFAAHNIVMILRIFSLLLTSLLCTYLKINQYRGNYINCSFLTRYRKHINHSYRWAFFRYHSMNSKVLRRMATDDQYWYNVSNFLLQSQLFGQGYHNLVSKRLTATNTQDLEELFCPFFNVAYKVRFDFSCPYIISILT
jgi:hypothetical protein